MLKKTLLTLLFGFNALAGESWLCTEDSSQLQGDSVAACGVGEGETEGKARRIAFNSAKTEFNEICGPDTECSMHKYAIEPKRTTCERIDGGWKCYRLMVFRVKNEPRRNAPERIIASQSSDRVRLSEQDVIDMVLMESLLAR